MRAAATAVGFSAMLPAKARPAVRSTVVARVPATRRSIHEAAATAVVAEPAEVSTVVARAPATRRSVDEAAATAVLAEPVEVDTVVARVSATRRSVDEAAATTVSAEPTEVDYSSRFSVFPMEACDLLGGDACIGIGRIYPEAKLPAAAPEASRKVDGVERDYLSYDGPKTVFPGEACDLLGGEFCKPPYQEGVYKELPHA